MLSQRAARGRHASACKCGVFITVQIRAWLQIYRADVLAMTLHAVQAAQAQKNENIEGGQVSFNAVNQRHNAPEFGRNAGCVFGLWQ